MLTIQNYSTVDLSRLLALRAAIAGAAPKHVAETSTELQAQLEFPGRDPRRDVYLARDNADVVGFGWIHPEASIGVAVAELGVLPRYRRRGIACALLENLTEAANKRSLDELRLRVDSSEQALAEFLARNGFRPIRAYVIMSASHPQMLGIPQTDSPAVNIRPFAAPDDVAALTAIQNAAFSGSFGFCPNTAQEVSTYLAMRGGHQGLFFASGSDRDEIAGYVWSSILASATTIESAASTDLSNRASSSIHRVSPVPQNPGLDEDVSEGLAQPAVGKHHALSARIEMIGVRPGARRQGIASVLLSTALLELERRGATSVELEVDSKNHSAIALYRRYGFRQTSESVCFGRDLDN